MSYQTHTQMRRGHPNARQYERPVECSRDGGMHAILWKGNHNITVTICISVVGPSGDPCLLVLGVGFSERLVADVRLMFFFPLNYFCSGGFGFLVASAGIVQIADGYIYSWEVTFACSPK